MHHGARSCMAEPMLQSATALCTASLSAAVRMATSIDLETHEFIIPQKEIKHPPEVSEKWEKSEVCCFLAHYLQLEHAFIP